MECKYVFVNLYAHLEHHSSCTIIFHFNFVQVIRGGRLMAEHFEEITNIVNERLDFVRQFFVWRVDSPWQSCTKRVRIRNRIIHP